MIAMLEIAPMRSFLIAVLLGGAVLSTAVHAADNCLNTEIVKVLRSPELVQPFAEAGGETIANTPEEFTAFIAKEQQELAELVKATRARLE